MPKSLSPLPDLLDGFRSQTPNRVPPSSPALFGGTQSLGTRYTGPMLIEVNKHESPKDVVEADPEDFSHPLNIPSSKRPAHTSAQTAHNTRRNINFFNPQTDPIPMRRTAEPDCLRPSE